MDLMENEQIDSFLFVNNVKETEYKEPREDRYIEHYLEQYRMYLYIFNNTNDRRQKSNEFFLGLNTAIIGILGYVETKVILNTSVVFTLVPIIGIAICYCWYEFINSYKQLNRAKFAVIHNLEKKLPATLFSTEWEILGKGTNKKKYVPFSKIERKIPIIFTILYIAIFLVNIPWAQIFILLNSLK